MSYLWALFGQDTLSYDNIFTRSVVVICFTLWMILSDQQNMVNRLITQFVYLILLLLSLLFTGILLLIDNIQ